MTSFLQLGVSAELQNSQEMVEHAHYVASSPSVVNRVENIARHLQIKDKNNEFMKVVRAIFL